MTAIDTMTAALDAAYARAEANPEMLFVFGRVDTPAGQVQVNLEPVDYKASLKRKFRKSWTLDGKRIAAAKLTALLNEQA